eukprot:9364791-Pyramimonas_sp.AAC.1
MASGTGKLRRFVEQVVVGRKNGQDPIAGDSKCENRIFVGGDHQLCRMALVELPRKYGAVIPAGKQPGPVRDPPHRMHLSAVACETREDQLPSVYSSVHKRTFLSKDPEASLVQSGLHTTEKEGPVWPARMREDQLSSVSFVQTRTAPSRDPEASRVPSGLHTNDLLWPGARMREDQL